MQMMLKKGKLGKIIIMLLCLLIVIPSFSVAADKVYRWNGGFVRGDQNTGLIFVQQYSGGSLVGPVYETYCQEKNVLVRTYKDYLLELLGNNNIRAILIKSYPNESISVLKDNVNNWTDSSLGDIIDLSLEEAITATQFAVWHYSDGSNVIPIEDDAERLYLYLIQLQPELARPIGSVDLVLVSKQYTPEGNAEIILLYTINGENADGSDVLAELEYNIDFDAVYPGTTITTEENAGIYTVNILIPREAITGDVDFTATIQGIQTISDVYSFIPVVSKSTQKLVGFEEKDFGLEDSVDVLLQYVEPTPTPTVTPEGGDPTPTATPEGGDPTPTATPEGGDPTPTATPEGGDPTPTATPEGGDPTPTATPEGGDPTPTVTPEGGDPTPTVTPEEGDPTPTVTPEEGEFDIPEEGVPLEGGLPQTGGIPIAVYLVIGSGLIAGGTMLRKRNK